MRAATTSEKIFVKQVTELYDLAHRLGFHATAQILHGAVQRVGYELEVRLTRVQITRVAPDPANDRSER